MKKALMTTAILLVFAFGASAQVTTPVSLYLGGAMSVPSGTFNEGWQMGYHGLAGVGYKMAPCFQVAGKVEYHNFGFNMTDLLGIDGGATKVWMYGVDGRYAFGMPTVPFKPFLMAGTGFARLQWDEFEGTSLITAALNEGIPDPVTKVYFNFGAGMELKTIPSFSLFVQARYVTVATEGGSLSFIPMSIGVKFF
ncbi:MAG: outer membrane beta-barrel protein [Candidatus Zixiibacteriota bacterium]|nr:MAG: outer membrane beta-barrel protein [candidate division Zixibacteria bacterium]